MRFIFYTFLLFSQIALAQKKKPETFTVYINYPAYTVRTEICALPVKHKPEVELEYYWYTANKIHHTIGGCDGKILNGQYVSFYLSNNLKEKGFFRKGLKDGVWISWNENGSMNESIHWKNGLKQGEYRKYGEKGDTLYESNYKSGKLDGIQREYENGKLKSEKKFKKGIEILPKEKKGKTDSNSKSSLKQKIKKLFSKHPKEDKTTESKSKEKKEDKEKTSDQQKKKTSKKEKNAK